MDAKTAALIETYQKTLAKDPKSKVFPLLADAYRRMGLLKEATDICKKGIRFHPKMPAGHLAFARILVELKNYATAREHLETALDFDTENLLAYNLLGDCCLKMKDPKSALKAFKMALFINPKDTKAQTAVKKLESLTADEYDDDLFTMQPLKQTLKNPSRAENAEEINEITATIPVSQTLDRFLSLADAFIVRNDAAKAIKALEEGEEILGPQPEITQRLQLLKQRQTGEESPKSRSASVKPRSQLYREAKIDYLQGLLQRIRERKGMVSP